MTNEIQLICSCGEKLTLDLSEEVNRKDVVYCDCGRNFVVVEITPN